LTPVLSSRRSSLAVNLAYREKKPASAHGTRPRVRLR